MADDSSVKKVIDLPIDDILPNRYQPRIKFDDDSIYELSESIKNHGVFQPILVRPIGDKYEIIAGERRYKASVLANKTTIPAIIMSLNDKDTVEVALIENVQRANLTPIEEAISYKKILDMGYIKQEALAQKLGKTQSTIANKIRLLNLDEDVQEALLENKISERHARSLLKLKEPSDQKIMLKRIINERLTVRRTDEEIDKMLNNDNNMNPINSSVVIDEVKPTIPTNEVPVVEEINPITVEQNNNATSIFGFSTPVEPMKAVTSANESTVISSDQAVEVQNVNVEQTDFNKIEAQSAPVFEEKPLADMDALLKSDAPATEKVEVAVTPEPVVEQQSTNRFFNFAPVEEKKEEEIPQVNPAGVGFNFNNFVTTEVKQPEPVATPVPNFDDMFEKQTKLTDEDEVIIPAPTQYTNFADTAAPVSEPRVIAPNNFTDTVSAPISEPRVIAPNNFANSVSDEIMAPKNDKKNVMAAVNVIREAVTKLESLGYSVDADEIDLDSIYQVIIKIDK